MFDAVVAMIAGPMMWAPGLNIIVGYFAFGGGGALVGLLVTLFLSGGAASNEKVRDNVRAKVKTWWEVLGVSPDASKKDISRAYRERAKRAHPDAGGSDDRMTELNRAREQALRTVK